MFRGIPQYAYILNKVLNCVKALNKLLIQFFVGGKDYFPIENHQKVKTFLFKVPGILFNNFSGI